MTDERIDGVKDYGGPAGGWGALRAVAAAVRAQMADARALLSVNQPDGFDCPGCAWPDKEHKSTFQFCENGAKAVTWEATTKRVTPAFLAANTVSSLLAKSDFELEGYGRLTHPLVSSNLQFFNHRPSPAAKPATLPLKLLASRAKP